MAEIIEGNDPKHFLFDCYRRTDRSRGHRAETQFGFFNRSAWRCAEIGRETLETWFANLPIKKKADLRSRFRADDGQHSGALLELVTHEILRAVAKGVQVEPDLNGRSPDFSAIYGDTRFIVECTVAQESDEKFGSLKRENVVWDAINSFDASPFKLMVRPISVGAKQPPASMIRRFLEGWLASLTDDSGSESGRSGLHSMTKAWKWQGWELQFEAIPINPPANGGAIGVTIGRPQVVNDSRISRALNRKAERYSHPRVPYIIVVAETNRLPKESVILDALFGRERWLLNDFGFSFLTRAFNGFYGSSSKPRNQHVSAVLYKRSMENVWSICGYGTRYSENGVSFPVPDWHLVHNPAAKLPLLKGMFTFAAEYIWQSEKLTRIEPARTLNDVLGLPNPWPGEEH